MKPGERIRELRKSSRQNQKDFSRDIGYSYGYLSDIERGKSEPSREFLKKLTQVHGVSSDYILYGSEEEQKKYIMVREAGVKYEVLPTSIKKVLDNVKEILDSKNEVMIDALKANVRAFLEAVRMTQKKNEDKGGS